MQQYRIDAIPYQHPKIGEWRQNFKGQSMTYGSIRLARLWSLTTRPRQKAGKSQSTQNGNKVTSGRWKFISGWSVGRDYRCLTLVVSCIATGRTPKHSTGGSNLRSSCCPTSQVRSGPIGDIGSLADVKSRQLRRPQYRYGGSPSSFCVCFSAAISFKRNLR